MQLLHAKQKTTHTHTHKIEWEKLVDGGKCEWRGARGESIAVL
jgi:hypothetical protein